MLQLLAQDQGTFASGRTPQNAETAIEVMRDKPPVRLTALQPPSPANDAFQQIRVPLRDVVAKTATQAAQLSQAIVQQALELGQMFWQMQRDLKTKEYKAFLSVLGWASAKVRKYINLAKTFDGFELSQLIKIELTTLLSLCSSRYSSVVAQLREVQEITQGLVEQLIKETRSPRKLKQDPISGWKQNRSGGGRRYEVILHDESTGLSIEQQALAERILPQRVIAEAVALRAEQKSSPVKADEHTSEESQTGTTPDAQSDSALLEAKRALREAQRPRGESVALPPKGDRCVGDLPSVVAEAEEVLPIRIPTSLVEEDTQELEAHTQEFQVGHSVKIVSARKGSEFDGQIGIVKTVSVVGCVVEALGKTVWFAIDELVLAPEETRIDAEWEAESQHFIEENSDFIDDLDQLNSLEV